MSAIISRLPADTMIQTTGDRDGMRIAISMTLVSPDEARALIAALEMAIVPLLEMKDVRASQAPETPSGQDENPEPGKVLSSAQVEGGANGQHPAEASDVRDRFAKLGDHAD